MQAVQKGYPSHLPTPDAQERVFSRQSRSEPSKLADFFRGLLASCHGSHDKKRLGSCRDCVWKRGVHRFVRQILFTSEEPHECPALACHMVANRSSQHRIPALQYIKDCTLGDSTSNLQFHLAAHASQGP